MDFPSNMYVSLEDGRVISSVSPLCNRVQVSIRTLGRHQTCCHLREQLLRLERYLSPSHDEPLLQAALFCVHGRGTTHVDI